MSHDKRNCPEASTWHVQLFFELLVLSHLSYLRTSPLLLLSLDLELRVHGVCPLLARHRLAIWSVAVSPPWYALYFLSLHSTGYNFFLDSLMSHQTLTARHNQLLQVGQAQRVFSPGRRANDLPLRSGLARGLSRDPSRVTWFLMSPQSDRGILPTSSGHISRPASGPPRYSHGPALHSTECTFVLGTLRCLQVFPRHKLSLLGTTNLYYLIGKAQ